MLSSPFRSLLLISAATRQFSIAAPSPQSDYTANAEVAFHTLQKWYNSTSGIYDTTGWWNSANCLTVIGDLAALDPRVTGEAQKALANSFIAAPQANLQMSKRIQPETMLMETIWDPVGIRRMNPKGFLNDYYDDEGWWALAWIQAYDVTRNSQYLQTAETIFADMAKGATTPCGGGIWWDKAHTYVNAIANELYLSVAAHLANRVTAKRGDYLDVAKEQWKWFESTGMINEGGTINDGLNSQCKTNNGTVWSYNQGVILGGLVELNRATQDSRYLNTASDIANAAIKALSGKDGVLHDPCEPNCGADGSQFKGIYMRGLQMLQKARGENLFETFIKVNADSIWQRNRNEGNELGIVWSGPVQQVNAGTQSSALDALVAAVALEGS